jgi:hypothetical protein
MVLLNLSWGTLHNKIESLRGLVIMLLSPCMYRWQTSNEGSAECLREYFALSPLNNALP